MNRLVKYALAMVLTIVSAPAFAGGIDPPGIDPLIPGRAMVRLPAGAAIRSFLAVLNGEFPTIEASVLQTYAPRNLYLLQFTPLPSHPQTDLLELRLTATYPSQGLLVYGELLYQGKTPEGNTGSIWVDDVATFSLYNSQYVRNKIRLPVAHARSVGASTVVAVLDTGVDTAHPLLAGRIAPGAFNFLNNSTNTADVGDGIDNDSDGATDEMVGHGTYVSGIIAMTAPAARILPIKVLDSEGKGSNWSLTLGMYHAIDRGVEVINLSLSSTYDSLGVIDAVREAQSRGIVVVAAAGNWNRSDPREHPAMDDDIPVIGVAATDDNDAKGDFSNFNTRLFISAPGANALAAGNPIPDRSIVSTLPGGAYGIAQGTSMATPLVSGAVALIRSQHPEWVAGPTTVTAIRERIRITAENINAENPGFVGELGHGRIDVGAAVELGPIAPGPGDVTNDGVVNVTDLLVLIADWGKVHSSADMNGSGQVDVSDLLMIVANWG